MITLTVNGKTHSVEAAADTPLLWVLREQIGLTGTKYGCGIGECGACNIHMNGELAKSCQISIGKAAGADITTIEGIAIGSTLHPVQHAYLENAALQCGFCTPGFIVASKALLEKEPDPSESQVRRWLAGNLCRCTGYDKIVRAVLAAAGRLRT